MDNDLNRRALDKFGKWLVEEIRDYSIQDCNNWLIKEWPETAEYLHWLYERLNSEFNSEQRELVLYLIPKVVDQVLHHLVWSLEQTKWIDVSVNVDSETLPTLRGVGDGMECDLIDWTKEYSKQRFDHITDLEDSLPKLF